jgi:hypothetical protein
MGNRELQKALREFDDERSSQAFHFPENPAKTICVESAELFTLFFWIKGFYIEKAGLFHGSAKTYGIFKAAMKFNLQIRFRNKRGINGN